MCSAWQRAKLTGSCQALQTLLLVAVIDTCVMDNSENAQKAVELTVSGRNEEASVALAIG